MIWPDTTSTTDDTLTIGGCAISELAKIYGTPLYIFDEMTIRNAARAFKAGMAQYAGGASVYYAGKALLNSAVVRLMAEEELNLDVVSLNELAIAQHAGFDVSCCHLHGNGTPVRELEVAVRWGIGRIIIDNFDQLDALIEMTKTLTLQQTVLLRIAPDVAAGGHAKIQTGKATSKFGFNIADGSAMRAIERANSAETLDFVGLHAHTGSQIRDFGALRKTIVRLFALAHAAREQYGWEMRELSPGGGLAVATHPDETSGNIAAYCAVITETVRRAAEKINFPLPHVSIEPGRALIARAGVALYHVTGYKRLTNAPDFLHISGGLGDNVRPSMYGARYTACNVNHPTATADIPYTIAGRYCESGDILIPTVTLPATSTGDVLAVPVSGAYTLSMASNYNGIGRPAVLFLRDGAAQLVQRRETWQDIVQRDA
jgi:diaminopimelate decarboxylase